MWVKFQQISRIRNIASNHGQNYKPAFAFFGVVFFFLGVPACFFGAFLALDLSADFGVLVGVFTFFLAGVDFFVCFFFFCHEVQYRN